MKFKEFIIQIDLIILGLSISSSIEILLNNLSWQIAFLFFVSTTMCINFFYAKMCELEQLSASLKTLYINFIKLLPLCFVSLSIHNLELFICSLIALRIADVLGILVDAKFRFRRISKMAKQWMIVDLISLVYLVLFFLNEFVMRVLPSFWIALLLMVFWIVDVIIDYKEEVKALIKDLDKDD